MFAKYHRDAYNLGNDFLRKKEDGTRYTIDDLIKDKHITDPKTIEEMKEDYQRGRKNFFWCHSCIS